MADPEWVAARSESDDIVIKKLAYCMTDRVPNALKRRAKGRIEADTAALFEECAGTASAGTLMTTILAWRASTPEMDARVEAAAVEGS